MCPSRQECVCLQGNATIRASLELLCFRGNVQIYVKRTADRSTVITGTTTAYVLINNDKEACVSPDKCTTYQMHIQPSQSTQENKATNHKTAASLVPVNAPLLPSLHLCHPLCTSSCSSNAAGQMFGHGGAERSSPATPRDPQLHLVFVYQTVSPRCQAPCTWGRPDRQTAVTGHGQRRLAKII